MPAISNAAIEYLQNQFRAYSPQFSYRPDGSVLMDLHDANGERIALRVLHKEEQENDVLLNSLVERIRRDLITEQGPLQPDNVDWFLKRIELRTFVPGNYRHRPRKIVVAGERLRALAERNPRW